MWKNWLTLSAGVEPGEGRPHEPGHGGEVPWQAQSPHALTVGGEVQLGGKVVFRLPGGEIQVIGQIGHLIVKGRVVGQNLCRIVIDLQTLFDGLHSDGAAPV